MLGRRFLRPVPALAAVVVAAALALVAAGDAAAHAYLVRSEPEAGSRLQQAPRTLVLYFSEPFVEESERISARVLGGDEIDLPAHVRRGTVVRQPLPAGLRGIIIVNWAVLSEDGHPSLGEFAFAVGTGAALPQAAAPPRQPTSRGLTAATWLFFVGLALALGGLVSERFVWKSSPSARAPVRLGLAAAAGGALLQLVLLGGGIGEVLDARAGRLTALILGLLVAAAIAARSSRTHTAAIVALLGAAAASAARGHSGTSGEWWAVPADAFHLAAAAVWIGALVHLVRVVHAARREGGSDLRTPVARYASLALATVSLAVVAGLVTALAQFGSLDELVDTGYGRTLLVKGALIGLGLAIALAARTRALGLPWAARGLFARLGVFELTTAATGLGLVALLIESSPLRRASSLVFAGAVVAAAAAVRSAFRANYGGNFGAAVVVAGVTVVVALNAGFVAVGAALAGDVAAANGEPMVRTRLALAAAAGILATAAFARAATGGALKLGLLRRLTTAEAAVLVAALVAAAVLVNAAPPNAVAVAARPDAALGPPPLRGPAVRLADLAGQIAVGVAATPRQLRFEVIVPSQEPVEDIRLVAEATRPGELSADLYPRRCGARCFTIRFRLPPGTTTVDAHVSAPGFAGGRVRFAIPWPPGPDRPRLLRRVARRMAKVPMLELTEAVTSGPLSGGRRYGARLSGERLLTSEMYRGGAVDVRVIGRSRGLTQLAFALPASSIWYRMWIDDRYLVRREIIVNRGHRITRTFKYTS